MKSKMDKRKGKKEQKENKLSKIDKTILDNFYKLVHTKQDVRVRASLSTYKILSAMKGSRPSHFNEHLNYCVERLVSGLASSRALARRGYGALLLEILENHQVSTERLFTIAQQKFGNISNETTPDNLLGYFLLISIIIESGNYKRSKQNANLLEKMHKYLVNLVRIKSYFDYPVSSLLSRHYDIFHPHLLASLPPECFGSGIKISHTDLLSLVLCNKKQPMREFSDLDADSIDNLSTSLTSDRLQRRPLHPVWIEYSALLMSRMPKQFESFYEKILAPTFFKPNHNELASMGLELAACLLERTEDANIIRTILNDYIVRLLILSQRSKSPLSQYCVSFFKNLSKSFEQSLKENSEAQNESNAETRQFCILNTLTSAPGSVAFDEDSKSLSIVNLLNHCRPEVLIKYLDKLTAILCKSFPANTGKRLHVACAKQIAHILQRPQMTMTDQTETTKRTTKFLIINCMFDSVSMNEKGSKFYATHGIPPFIEHLDPAVRVALKSTYHAAMAHLVATCSTLQRIEILGQIVDFCEQLFSVAKVEFRDENSKTGDLWPKYYSHLTGYRKLSESSENSKILYPISNLYLFYGLQVIEYGLDCIAHLDELDQSSKEALKNDPNDGSWADVLTDQIIAILSATECSPWIRKICVSVFGSLLPHVSETSIDLICEALTSTLEGDDCDLEDEEEESDDADSEDSEEDDEDSEEGSDGENSDEIFEDAEDMQDEEVEASDGDRMSVQEDNEQEKDSAKGDSDENVEEETKEKDGSEDDDDEEYLTDEQMMKMDSVIADMFRLNRIGKKQRRDPSFQLRLLDLVKKILAKKRNDAEVVRKILASIGPVAAKTRKSAELRPIASKIDKMMSKISKKNKKQDS